MRSTIRLCTKAESILLHLFAMRDGDAPFLSGVPPNVSPRALGSVSGREMREDLLEHGHSRCRIVQGRRAGVIGTVL